MNDGYALYYAPSTASLAVHWFLLELGVPHHLVRVDLDAGAQRSPEYLRLNPNGVVPTMIIDGQPVFEVAALLMLLAERHSEAGFAPGPGAPDRASYLMWMVHLANTVQPAYRAWFYPTEPAGEAHVEAVKQAARARIEAAWERVATHLEGRDYMLGERISVLDFLTTMLMRWSRNMPKPATEWPVLAAYVRRMKSRPTFAELYRREGLTDWT